MLRIRDIDRWFIDRVLPHANAYHRQARRWAINADAVEDIVQEAYARVITMQGWQALLSPKAYMLLVVRNIAIDRLRRAQAVPFDRAGDSALLTLADDAPNAFEQLASRGELRRLRAAIADLPPQCRRVIEMRKLEERSPGEIAEMLGISVSTVEKHLAKGVRLVMLALTPPAAEQDETTARDQQHGRSAGGSGAVAGATRHGNR